MIRLFHLSIYLLLWFNLSKVISFSIKKCASPQILVQQRNANRFSNLFMHFGHDHSHGHSHSHNDGTNTLHHENDEQNYSRSFLGQLFQPKLLFRKPYVRVIIASIIFIIPVMIRRKVTKLDWIIFGTMTTVLSIFDVAKIGVKSWISRMKLFRDGLIKHSTPMNSNYLFKNNNLADRVTLLGVAINIVLSIAKFAGGILFNSAVLVADAGHSLSDLLSDFITLWAVQIARLPADSDHPYGHGKFESVGSLFLSLTLIATGFSVGTWSYEKMHEVIMAQRLAKTSLFSASSILSAKMPSWPALLLAGLSIVSKEWLFRITKRVGDSLNSQILIANAWHHRSDSFSSILSLLSIGAAIFLPGLLIADSAAGILVAGMICLTGFEVMSESVKQLTDSTDERLVSSIAKLSRTVEGVQDVANIRARSVGSGNLVDLTVIVDMKLSSSAAHSIAERTRWKIMDAYPQIIDILVRTQSSNITCPLLSRNQRTSIEIERSIRTLLSNNNENNDIKNIQRVTVHYVNTAMISLDLLIEFDSKLTVTEARNKAKDIKKYILEKDKDIYQVDIQLDLNEKEDVVTIPGQ
eukprot:gene5176-7203_t